MLLDLFKCDPFPRIISDHLLKQVDETQREPIWSLSCFCVESPEHLILVGAKQSVVSISRRIRSHEGRILAHHYEDNNTQSKDINALTVIRPVFMYFRGHVLWGSKVSSHYSTAVVSYQRRRESKVSHLQIEVLIEKQIIRLQISVRNAHCMDMFNGFNQLMEVISCNIVLEKSSLDQVFDLSSFTAVL